LVPARSEQLRAVVRFQVEAVVFAAPAGGNRGSESHGLQAPDILHRLALYFANLPLWMRLATLVGVGLALLALAVRRFEYEFPTALLYLLLAVMLFWMAIASVM
jgi:hypothetical protein